MSQIIESVEKEEGKPSVTTAYLYDLMNRLVKISDSEGGEPLYSYDKAGNLIKEEGSEERHYLYDACGRLTAVTDRDNLLLAALYDGNDNRVFTMEYTPELSSGAKPVERQDRETPSGQEEEREDGGREEGKENPGETACGGRDWGAGDDTGNPSGKNSTGSTGSLLGRGEGKCPRIRYRRQPRRKGKRKRTGRGPDGRPWRCKTSRCRSCKGK